MKGGPFFLFARFSFPASPGAVSQSKQQQKAAAETAAEKRKKETGMRHLKSRRRGNRGFTLVEVVISMAILMIIGVSAIGSVIYTRQAMELNKQQLAALNYARQSLERVSSLGNISGGTVTLVPFNAPGLEIDAEVVTTFYPFFGDGSVDWDTPALVVNNEDASMQLTALDQGKPYLCHVSVNWIPSGSWSRQQTVSIQSIVRRGVR